MRLGFGRAVLAVVAAALAAVAMSAAAQGSWPTRPVKIIVPFPPGQAADTFARLLAERLTPLWGQQVVVENKAGGGGVPGIEAGRTAAPDGYTLLMGTSGTLGINPVVYSKLPYDAQRDFAPASNVFIAPLIVVAHPSFAPNTIAELIALAQREPGKINYGSAGPGTAQHMTGELFKSKAGIDLVHVPYKGSAPAMTDLLGGQIPLMFDSLTSALPHIRSGKLKALAITTASRSPELPNVPTIGETVAGFDAAGWSGIVLPRATPAEIVNKVSADIQRLLKEAPLRDEILKRGSIPDPTTSQQFADFIRSENAKWGAVAKTAQVKLD